MVSFVSFAFISALIFKISLLLLTLGFFISSFSCCFRCSVQSLSRVRLFVTPWIAALQASLSTPTPGVYSNSFPSSRWCHPAISSSVVPFSSCPPVPPSIRVFSTESTLRTRWPKYWSFSFSISPSNEHPGLISFRMDCWISLQSKGLSRVFSNTTVQKNQFFGTQLSSQSDSRIHT